MFLMKMQFRIERTGYDSKNLHQVISNLCRRSWRPSLIVDGILKTIIDKYPFLTTSQIAKKLNTAQKSISDHIRMYEKYIVFCHITNGQNFPLALVLLLCDVSFLVYFQFILNLPKETCLMCNLSSNCLTQIP